MPHIFTNYKKFEFKILLIYTIFFRMLYILKIFNKFKKFNFYRIYTSFRFCYKHRFLIRIIDNKSLGAFLCAAFKIKNGTNSVTSKVYTKKPDFRLWQYIIRQSRLWSWGYLSMNACSSLQTHGPVIWKRYQTTKNLKELPGFNALGPETSIVGIMDTVPAFAACMP